MSSEKDFKQWEQELSDDKSLDRLDRQIEGKDQGMDELAQAAEDRQAARALESRLAAPLALEQQKHSEAAARQKLAELNMADQRQKLEQQIESELPGKVLKDQMLNQLLENLGREDRVGNFQLTSGATSGPVIREAIALLFRELELPDPFAQLDAPPSGWRERFKKHPSRTVETTFHAGSRQGQIMVQKFWPASGSDYFYFVGGGRTA